MSNLHRSTAFAEALKKAMAEPVTPFGLMKARDHGGRFASGGWTASVYWPAGEMTSADIVVSVDDDGRPTGVRYDDASFLPTGFWTSSMGGDKKAPLGTRMYEYKDKGGRTIQVSQDALFVHEV